MDKLRCGYISICRIRNFKSDFDKNQKGELKNIRMKLKIDINLSLLSIYGQFMIAYITQRYS